MTPLLIVLPVSLILFLFVSVYAGVGLGLIVLSIFLNIRSWCNEGWRHWLGSAIGGVILSGFGWVILKGSWVTGSTIIDGLITRFTT